MFEFSFSTMYAGLYCIMGLAIFIVGMVAGAAINIIALRSRYNVPSTVKLEAYLDERINQNGKRKRGD